MITTLFLSVSIDGFIANADGIPMFPEGAWEDWCALVNDAGNVIAGRTSVEQLAGDAMASILTPRHKIVLSSRDTDLGDAGWTHGRSPAAALEMLASAGIDEAIVGGGRAVYHSFLRAGLVDRIVMDLQPIAFGTGIPMFGDVLDATRLRLLDTHPLNADALRLRYELLRTDA